MKIHIIRILLISIFSIIFALLEAVNAEKMLMLYRATTTFVVSMNLAEMINGME